MQFNHKEGMVPKREPEPSGKDDDAQEPPEGGFQGIRECIQTPFLNPDPFQSWYRVENVAKV